MPDPRSSILWAGHGGPGETRPNAAQNHVTPPYRAASQLPVTTGPYEGPLRRASGAYDSFATVYVMRVGLLASDGCFSSGLTALIDVLSTAQAARPAVDPSIPPIRMDVTGIGRKVTTGPGLTVPVTMHLRELPAA